MFSVLMLYLSSPSLVDLFFFFNDTATTEIYTLSLHDALPISRSERRLLGVSRPAGRLGEHLGRLRDDHLGAVRQLVAQRLRPGREGAVAPPHPARPGDLGDSAGGAVPGALAPEPRLDSSAATRHRAARGLHDRDSPPERGHDRDRAGRLREPGA